MFKNYRITVSKEDFRKYPQRFAPALSEIWTEVIPADENSIELRFKLRVKEDHGDMPTLADCDDHQALTLEHFYRKQGGIPGQLHTHEAGYSDIF
jgi:hypothetical protein